MSHAPATRIVSEVNKRKKLVIIPMLTIKSGLGYDGVKCFKTPDSGGYNANPTAWLFLCLKQTCYAWVVLFVRTHSRPLSVFEHPCTLFQNKVISKNNSGDTKMSNLTQNPSNLDLYDEITKVVKQTNSILFMCADNADPDIEGSLWAATDILERFGRFAEDWSKSAEGINHA